MLTLLSAFLISITFASNSPMESSSSATYRTDWGKCPEQSASQLTLLVMKEYEKTKSLKKIKEKLLDEKWDEKYFLSDYRISINPVANSVRVILDCPTPLAKLQIYKANGEEHFSAILGDNAKLYEPGYENLLRAEKKLTNSIPRLAIPLDMIDQDAPKVIARFMNELPVTLKGRISEIIYNEKKELTLILGFSQRGTSVFLGEMGWREKTEKLTKIVKYIETNHRYPLSINLVNAKKVVVKFSDKI